MPQITKKSIIVAFKSCLDCNNTSSFLKSNSNPEYHSGFFCATPHTYPLIYPLLSATIYTWSGKTNTPESVAREALLIRLRIGDYNNGSQDFKYEQ